MESDLANHLERRLRALVLGAIDMYDACETARYLLGDHPEAAGHAEGAPWRVRRTMETGMIVTYARRARRLASARDS